MSRHLMARFRHLRTAMPSRTVTVGSDGGLHARPASIVTDAVLHHQMHNNAGPVTLSVEGQPPVDASHFMSVMGMEAFKGTPVTVSADNEDAMHEVADIIAHNHDRDKSYYNKFTPFSFDQLYEDDDEF